MPLLFFLPWVGLRETLSFPELELIPYERERAPGTRGATTQQQLDAILGNYGDRFPQNGVAPHVKRAVVVHWHGTEFAGEVAESEVEARMRDGQLVAFAGLSERTYGNHSRYTNNDELGMFAQWFDRDNPGRVSAVSRRRDGGTNHGFSSSVPIKFLRPLHVSHHATLNVDKPLLAAVLAARGNRLPSHVLDAISVYNRANTDAEGVSDDLDLVLHRVALETLTQSSHATSDLKQKLIDLTGLSRFPVVWHPGTFGEQVWSARWPKCGRPFEAWVEDLCNARNQRAHGGSGPNQRPASVWSVRNHLMFVSWLFPLLVKAVLHSDGLYSLTEGERDRLTGSELFLAHDVSEWGNVDDGLKWASVEQTFTMRQLQRHLAAGGAK